MNCGECPWFRKRAGCTHDVVEHDEECGMRRAFRIVRDEYRLCRKRAREGKYIFMYAYQLRQEERACVALAHGLQIANLMQRPTLTARG